MQVHVTPGGTVEGSTSVPGDKSIAHRWLILASTASGPSRLDGLPVSLDVCSTAACMAALSNGSRPALELWARNAAASVKAGGSTWNPEAGGPGTSILEVEGEGFAGMVEPERALGCGNSGTTMRLLMGLVAGAPIRTVLTGDASLSRRPMERVAAPLRELGASIQTLDGHAPVRIEGGSLHGADLTLAVPSAQVKSAVLLAGLVADGRTRVTEPVVTRDHTERALAALGAPIERSGPTIEVEPFQHRGFGGVLPGDPSSAAFLAVAAALTGSGIAVHGLGLNPTRLSFLAVLERMGVPSRTTIDHEVVGEPVGVLQIMAPGALRPTVIPGEELPCIIDEVPVLAMLATATGGETRFVGASELRVKESDRLAALVEGIRALGGEARADGDDLIVHGTGLAGGRAQARGDHRMAMAFAVGALGALASCEIEGMDAADVSFPGFIPALASLGAQIEVQG